MPGKARPDRLTPATVITEAFDVLFPGTTSLNAPLRLLVLDGLTSLPFEHNRSLQPAVGYRSEDFGGMDVVVDYPRVELIFPGRPAPLTSTRLSEFSLSAVGYWSKWTSTHPLRAALDNPGSSSALADLGEMLDYIVWRVRSLIYAALDKAIKSHALIVYGVMNTDPMNGIRLIPARALDQDFRLDPLARTITFDNSLRITQVSFERADSGAQQPKKSLSLDEADRPLIEEMHGLVSSTLPLSISAAARTVAHKAEGTGTLASKIQRLRHRYANEYGRPRRKRLRAGKGV